MDDINNVLLELIKNKGLDRKHFIKMFYVSIESVYQSFKNEGNNDAASKLLTMKILNLVLARYEYFHNYPKLISRPIFIKFDPSNACQLHCPGCMHSLKYKEKNYWGADILPWDSFKKNIDSYAPYAFNCLMYYYGEPFLNNKTAEMIKYVRKFCVPVTISTNLSIDINSESIVSSGLDTLICSIDGASQENYEKYRRGGNIEKVKYNLLNLSAEKRHQNRKNPNIIWQFLTFKHNEKEVLKAKKIAEESGVSQFLVAKPYSVKYDDKDIIEITSKYEGWHDLYNFDYEKYCENKNRMIYDINSDIIEDEFENFKKRINLFLNSSDLINDSSYGKEVCDWIYKAECFDAKGRIFPCCYANPESQFNDFVLGNINDYGDSYNSEKLVRLRKDINSNINCKLCNNRAKVDYDNSQLNRDLKQYTWYNKINRNILDKLTEWESTHEKKDDKKMEFTGERMVIGQTDEELETEHLNRYYFAKQFVSGKTVLDAACGTGYGSAILSPEAKSVIGIDISKEAVDYANDLYKDDKVSFIEGSVAELPFDDDAFDVVVSFETIEHVGSKEQNMFLKEIKRVMKSDGILIMSSPNHSVYKNRGENHFHVKELDYLEFKILLESKFKYVRFFSQKFEICNSILSNTNSYGNINNCGDYENAEYLIAVCSQENIPDINTRIFVDKNGKLENLKSWAIENHNTNERNNKYIAEQNEKIIKYEAEINNKSAHIEQLLQSERTLTNEKTTLIDEVERRKNENEISYNEIKRLNEHIEKISDWAHSLESEKNNIERDFKNTIEDLTKENDITVYSLNNTIEKLENEVTSKRQIIEIKNNEIEKLKTTIKNKEGHIELLLETEREFERLKKSRAWKIMLFIWKLSSIIIPHGSKRRLFVKTAVKFLRHPIIFIKKLSPKRVGKFFYYLRREGAESVSRRLDDSILSAKVEQQEIVVNEVNEEAALEKTADDYEKIIVPEFNKIEVSIIIPVYNQFEYTYKCIKSIVENSGDVKYEIIVANDCSTDITLSIADIIYGIKVINNEKNLRFLLNCNNAAKYANGKYILFLNNDTQVQNNWLKPLVELIERDEKIGMVGSKLVYPDGRLQEAGGILWKDGSAWNYGHLSDPNDPEYNYVKEADYISGASIMIKKELWNKIGGFDKRYAPAYYEDTDLAFEVRRHGYKVMYQPLSVVVHFEGISNGTDVTSGQKAYQKINSDKFFEKWQNVLEKEHYPNGENVFKAKDRSGFKKHILVVDHYVPHYDQDAGGKCTWMYMKLFLSLGMKVTFIGDNFFKHEPYSTELTQMGVEFLYGNYYYNNWKKWLEQNACNFDYAYLNRPHISEKYIDILKKYSSCKIIYFGHDLHYLREYRQYEIEKDPAILKSSNEWKKREFNLFNKADIIYVVGSYEQGILKKEFPDKPVRNIPVYIYDVMKENVNTDFSSRKDIMFVGGFGHPPNGDAVLWFAQNVFKKIVNRYPDIKWYIVGSKPTEEILKLDGGNIKVTGFIDDEELEKLYSQCRMSVVPLRVGAGVKGKVVEAVYNRIPLVTTPIGAEGLSLDENAFVVCDCDADKMAETINSLYEDYGKLKELSDNCVSFIENHFTVNVAKNVVLKDIDYEEKRILS